MTSVDSTQISHLRRRTVVGAAWTAPVILAASQSPAFAASITLFTITFENIRRLGGQLAVGEPGFIDPVITLDREADDVVVEVELTITLSFDVSLLGEPTLNPDYESEDLPLVDGVSVIADWTLTGSGDTWILTYIGVLSTQEELTPVVEFTRPAVDDAPDSTTIVGVLSTSTAGIVIDKYTETENINL